MAKSPTISTMEVLREAGLIPDVVERRKGRFVTHDFLGLMDVVAVGHGTVIGVQACAQSGVNVRIERSLGNEVREALKAWLGAGCLYEVWSWQKRKPPGAFAPHQMRWMVCRTGFVLADDGIGGLAMKLSDFELPKAVSRDVALLQPRTVCQ